MAYGAGDGPIFLDGLNCDGSEESLMDCDMLPNAVSTCTHQNDVGVHCQSILIYVFSIVYSDCCFVVKIIIIVRWNTFCSIVRC